MLMVIDVGNTNTVIGVFRGETLLEHWRLETLARRTSDEFGILLRQFFQACSLEHTGIDGAIISCVMPTMLSTVVSMLKRYFNVEPMIVGPGVRTGMPILYENPREVGADRIVNAVAAYTRFKQGLIIVDFGTATTFDAISPRGQYMGGVIAPGIGISAEALFHKASKLPRVELIQPPKVIGRNTIISMQSGIFYGYVGLVEEIVSRMRDEMTGDTRCIATGGLAEIIAAEAHCIEQVIPQLTLEGLRILYQRNHSA